MASLSSTMSVALSGIQTATSQMKLAASNLSNAGTQGYSRQVAVLESDIEGGVKIVGYKRIEDVGTYRALSASTSSAGYYSTLKDCYADIESLLGSDTGNTVLADNVATFISDWQELAASPESATLQAQVVQDGVNMAQNIQTTYSEISQLERQVKSDINTSIDTLNSDLDSIFQLNKEISSQKAQGMSTGSLEDSRDAAILDVASKMNVTVMDRGDGTISLYTRAGYALIDGSVVRKFDYNGTDVYSLSDTATSLNDVLIGGSLQAAVDFVSNSSPAAASADNTQEVIRKLRDQVSTIAEAFLSGSDYDTAYGSTDLFFTGSNGSNIEVNSGLVDGSISIDTANADDVIDLFNRTDLTFTADGLTASNISYNEMATTVISGFQQDASSAANLYTSAESERSYLEETYANNTGVSTDTELVSLTTLETSYNACAKIISTVNDLFDTLMNMA